MDAAVLVTIVLQVITPKTGRLDFWWVLPVLEFVALLAVTLRDPGRGASIGAPVRQVRHPPGAVSSRFRGGPEV